MKIYRLTFAKNEVISCKEVNQNTVFQGLYHYETSDAGHLIYAIIKAENEENAITIANFIRTEIKQKGISPEKGN